MKLVARGGPIREANQDSAAARRVRIGLSRSESIEPSTESLYANRLPRRLSMHHTRIFSPLHYLVASRPLYLAMFGTLLSCKRRISTSCPKSAPQSMTGHRQLSNHFNPSYPISPPPLQPMQHHVASNPLRHRHDNNGIKMLLQKHLRHLSCQRYFSAELPGN